MTAEPITVMMGWNQDWLTSLDNVLPENSVIVLEERDLYEGKRIAERWAGHPVVREVRFTEYQQSDRFREEIDAILAETPVRGVLPGLEYSVEATAVVADQLGLPGAGTRAASVLTDKLNLRHACAQAGLVIPRFAEVSSSTEVSDFTQGGPCVLKPANRQASLGVVRLEAEDDVDAAWQDCVGADEGAHVVRRQLNWRYVAEELLRGPEYSVEALVRDGEVLFTNITYKRVTSGRHPIERGHVVPAPPAPGVDTLSGLTPALVAALGFRSGVLHAEWIIDGGQPTLVECAARPPGDSIFELVRLTQGVDLYVAADEVLSGQVRAAEDSPAACDSYAAVDFLLPDRPGTVTKVMGAEEAADVPGVYRIPLLRAPGEVILSVDSSWCRLASVIATGPSADAAQSASAAGLARIKVEVSPDSDPVAEHG